jgi:L-threonylcarbamoyladenylate synthase
LEKNQIVGKDFMDDIAMCVSKLLDGHLIAIPTETVYGLAADACNAQAIARIFEVKGRPIDHPLIVHVSSVAQLDHWAKEIPSYALVLANKFWPGPMTLVLKKSPFASDLLTGGQDSIGLRIPNHKYALALLEGFKKVGGKGIAAPSANRFGHVSPTSAEAVVDELGGYLSADDLVLDGGACAVGIESTIIDCTGPIPRILRPGAISGEMIFEFTGLKIHSSSDRSLIRVSGSLESHYAPKAKVVLDEVPEKNQGFIAFANVETPPEVIRLASPKSLEEYAQSLYWALREADIKGLDKVFVIQPLDGGIGIAIRDRLSRAAKNH